MARGLDLGIFLPNAKGGGIMASGEPPQYFPTWELNKKNSLIAEASCARANRSPNERRVLAITGTWFGSARSAALTR